MEERECSSDGGSRGRSPLASKRPPKAGLGASINTNDKLLPLFQDYIPATATIKNIFLFTLYTLIYINLIQTE